MPDDPTCLHLESLVGCRGPALVLLAHPPESDFPATGIPSDVLEEGVESADDFDRSIPGYSADNNVVDMKIPRPGEYAPDRLLEISPLVVGWRYDRYDFRVIQGTNSANFSVW